MFNDKFYMQRMGAWEGPYQVADLLAHARAGSLNSTSLVSRDQGQTVFPASEIPGLFSQKEWIVAFLLSFFVGHFGVDRFYVGQTGMGIAKLLTCGGVGVWTMIVIVLFAMNKINDEQGLPLKR